MIFSAFERMVAMRYLRARRQEGFVSVIAGFSLLGIGLGVATLIIVMAVMNGFREELLGRIIGVNGHLSIYGPGGAVADFDPLAERLRHVQGVVTVSPLVEGQVMATAGERATGALVRGIRREDFERRPILATSIKQGSLDDFKPPDAVILGDRLAARLNVRVGDQVTLIAPQGNVTVFGTVPRLRAYTVVATFDVGMYEYDSTYVYMPLASAQVFFRLPEQVSTLEVVVDNADDVRQVYARMAPIVGGARIVDWQQSNSGFFNALQVERNVMFLILTLIILVAAFNIISSLIMMVKDKGRDIAIMRTMGATKGMIMRVFFLSGASVGVIGTLVGLGLGVAICRNLPAIQHWLESMLGRSIWNPEIRFLAEVPAIIDWNEVSAVILMALFLSFAATIYPSWRAARLDPVEALRYE